jgi:hypothetical protein
MNVKLRDTMKENKGYVIKIEAKFLQDLFNTASSAARQISLSEDSRIEPRTIATSTLPVQTL